MIEYNGKEIVIRNRKIQLEYLIKKVLKFNKIIVVLFYDNKIVPNNVVAYDLNGNQIWEINDILNIKKPTGNVDIKKSSENILSVCSDLSIEYQIDVNKCELVNKTYLR